MIQRVKVNLFPSYNMILPVIHLKQYDKTESDEGKQIELELYSGSDVYEVPSGAVVTIQGTKKDKTGYQYEVTNVEGNLVTVNIKDQMTVLSGNHFAELRIVKSGSIINSTKVVMDIDSSALQDDTAISETDLPMIEKAAEAYTKILDITAEVEANAKSASESATQAKTSETNASTSEVNAKESETNAKASEESASASATTATTKAEEASTSATNASTSETNASTSEVNAKESETNAKASEESASASATTATTKAEEASTSATNASTSETNAKAYEEDAKKAVDEVRNVTGKSAVFEELEPSQKTFSYRHDLSTKDLIIQCYTIDGTDLNPTIQRVDADNVTLTFEDVPNAFRAVIWATNRWTVNKLAFDLPTE